MTFPLADYWRLLADYLAPQRAKVLLLGALLLGNVGLQLISPLLLRRFIDATVAGSPLEELTRVALLFIAVAVVGQGLGVGEAYVAEDVGWTTTNRMRQELMAHCLRLAMPFHNAHLPGELIERIDGDVAALASFFSRFAPRVLSAVLLLVGALAVLAVVDWRLGATFAVFVAVALTVLRRVRDVAVPFARVDRETSAGLFGYIEERLSGTEDVRARGATGYVLLGLYRATRARLWARRNAAAMYIVAWGTMILVFAAGTALAFVLGGTLFRAGLVTVGTVFLIVSYARTVTGPLSQLSQQLQDLQQATASLARVRELLAVGEEVADVPGGAAVPLPAGALGVELDGVTFAYAAGPDGAAPPVLEDVSLRVEPGQVLGLLGRTGSGKTTITRLLVRLYDPLAGAVRLGGVDLRAARTGDVRARVGMVTQEVQLFEASVRDNLTFFDPAVPEARIAQALNAVGLGAWRAALPRGLDTPLAAHGAGLSAGEAQLLAFARVFLKDPGLVILDEASSRLDPATERRIERAVDVLLQGRTAVIVAHRLATVRRADAVLILEGGRVRERGARAALAADPDSRFAGLLRAGLEAAPG